MADGRYLMRVLTDIGGSGFESCANCLERFAQFNFSKSESQPGVALISASFHLSMRPERFSVES